MTTFYVVDSYEARLRRKNAFLESKAAEEKALRYACALNRPVSVYEVNNARESEWPVVKKAQQYWGMAKPTGEFEKSKDGKNPYTAFMDEQTQKDKHEDVEYHEDKSVETALRMRIEASLKEVKSVRASHKSEAALMQTPDHAQFIHTENLQKARDAADRAATGAEGLVRAIENAQKKHEAGGEGFNMQAFLVWSLIRAKDIMNAADEAAQNTQLSSGGFGSAANNGKIQGKFMTKHSKQATAVANDGLSTMKTPAGKELEVFQKSLSTINSLQVFVKTFKNVEDLFYGEYQSVPDLMSQAARILQKNISELKAGNMQTNAAGAAPAVAHHLQSGDVALVDKKDKAFVIDSAEGIYVILLNGSVTQFPDDPNRIAAVHGEDPHKKQWKSFIQVLLKQQGVNKLEELDSEQKTRFYDLAKRKWPKVEKRMNHHEKPAPQHPKEPQPEAESSFSLAKFCNDLCKNDFEQAAALEEHVRSSVRNDAVKAHAMSLLRNWGLYVLPRGWYDTAKACFENERKVVASRKLSAVDMVPPVAVRAEATSAITRALKEGVALPAYTQKLARSVATGAALDLGTVERMSVFFQTQSDKERAWAAWGGNTGKAWVESLKQKI